MLTRVLFLALSCLVATPVHSETMRLKYFLNCSSAQIDLTFEINTIFRTVRNVNYNTYMEVAYWSTESINTTFSIEKSMSQILSEAQRTDNVSVNFDRLNGVASVAGIIAPTETQINQCKSQRNWGCESWFVTETHEAQCVVVEQKF